MILIFILISYLLGSIPFGLILVKAIKGIDVRTQGSGNIGATNVFRVAGKKFGMLVFSLDAFKGFLAVSLPSYFEFSLPLTSKLLLAIAVILGHSFPVWLRFKGGKGVATSLGVFLGLSFIPTLITFGIWILIFLVSRIISVASLAAALTFPIVIAINFRSTSEYAPMLVISILLSIFMFYTHRANIQRLLRGEEKKLF